MNMKFLFEKFKVEYLIKNNIKRAEYLRRKGIRMGENCNIAGKVSFGSEPYLIKLGNNVKASNRVQFMTHDGGMYVLRNTGDEPEGHKYGCIEVGNNVFLGRECVIMPGVKIGDNCIIGMRALVTKNIPSNSVVAGMPAKVICTLEEYHKKNKENILNTTHMTKEEKKEFLIKYFFNNK